MKVDYRSSGNYTGFDLILFGSTTKTMFRLYKSGKIEVFHSGIDEPFTTPTGTNN